MASSSGSGAVTLATSSCQRQCDFFHVTRLDGYNRDVAAAAGKRVVDQGEVQGALDM
jgi:hypothetical protein